MRESVTKRYAVLEDIANLRFADTLLRYFPIFEFHCLCAIYSEYQIPISYLENFLCDEFWGLEFAASAVDMVPAVSVLFLVCLRDEKLPRFGPLVGQARHSGWPNVSGGVLACFSLFVPYDARSMILNLSI